MRHKKVKLCAVFLFVFELTGLKAQEAIPATGGNASGIGGSASYTVGQIVYTTNTGTNGSVAQGVQQPYEISVVTGIEDNSDVVLIVSAYPNPVTNCLQIIVERENVIDLIYQLFDINGKLLESKKIEENSTIIVMSNLVPATYFLKINKMNKEIKAFKIIKN